MPERKKLSSIRGVARHGQCHGNIYLNYAATSFPKSEIAIASFMRGVSMLPEGSRQNRADTALQECRQRIGNILHIDAKHVFFTSSATLGINQIIRGFAKDKDCLAIDNRSHSAVIRSCQSLHEGSRCIIADIYDEMDRFLEANLLRVLRQSPSLLCLNHLSNVNGSIYPVEEIIGLVQAVSPLTSILVDASQSAGAVTLSKLSGADFIVFPSHKHLHSLPGAAVVAAKKRLRPIIFGGTGVNSSGEETLLGGDLFAEVGTMNFPAILALTDSLEYAESRLEDHRKQEKRLVVQFLEGVRQIDGMRVIGRGGLEERGAIVALNPEFGSPETFWVPLLRTQGILVRGGLHCSPLHHRQLGLSHLGTLRFSFGWDSTEEHVKKALQSLGEVSCVSREVVHDSSS